MDVRYVVSVSRFSDKRALVGEEGTTPEDAFSARKLKAYVLC